MSNGLHERIAAAFATGAKSSDVTVLIGQATAAAVASADTADRARTRALDPALSAADVIEARRDMDDASFQRDRLLEAVRRLGERLRELKWQEEQSRRQLAYDAALIERDKLAEEVARTYPALAAQLAKLVTKIAENDEVIERVNRKSRPDGALALESAEAIARGLRGFVVGGAYVARITTELRIPAFQHSEHDAFAWPRPRSGFNNRSPLLNKI